MEEKGKGRDGKCVTFTPRSLRVYISPLSSFSEPERLSPVDENREVYSEPHWGWVRLVGVTTSRTTKGFRLLCLPKRGFIEQA